MRYAFCAGVQKEALRTFAFYKMHTIVFSRSCYAFVQAAPNYKTTTF